MDFVKNRIAFLRTDKNISARELSLRLGQSNGYISSIETGKSKPSVDMLIYICEELGVSMSEFFDEGQTYPILAHKIMEEAKKLDKSSLESILSVMKNLSK